MKRLFVLLIITFWGYTIFARSENAPADSLEVRFLNPPASAKPYVWWHWMGPNFSKEGITKDLEAMKEEGIGGATIFNIASAVQESHVPTLNNPWPEQTYRSPAYWDAVKHAAAEARRLGLEIGLHNTAGYSTTGGPWITEDRGMQKVVWSDTLVSGGKTVSLILTEPELPIYKGWGTSNKRATLYHDIAVLAVPDRKQINSADIHDLSGMTDASGILKWNAPEGQWRIYRIGYAPTMSTPHPLPDDLIGKSLEVDKMDAAQNTFHWDNVLQPLKQNLGEYMGKSFRHILIDSYEAGYQNWTTNFRKEFIKRKGYDPVPWLISLGSPVTDDKENTIRRVINSEEQTSRFEWDYRDVINQLYFEDGWNVGKKLVNKAGLSLFCEPYSGPFSTCQGAALADIPMGEFWTGGKGTINSMVPAAARAAGKRIVGAEAFTGRPERSKWTEDPAFLKFSADGAFSSGVNRLILHHWVHQPFSDKYQPGMGMGWWGTHFGRNQTWFEPGKAFFAYLARCQVLLQHGEQVADYLCLDEMVGFSDVISKNDFLSSKIRVKNGKIILPSGRSYPFMVFPGEGEMLPEVARKIKKLAAEGATIVSAKPTHSPSLKDFPESEEELKKIAGEVWGTGNQNRYGKGLVFTKLEDAVKKYGITPDYIVEKAETPENIKVVHRHSEDADIYFVVNQNADRQHVAVSLRISGKQPELWQAEDCSIENAPVWQEKDGRTIVSLNMKGTQSVFIVFRKNSFGTDHPVSVSVQDTSAEWDVRTDKEGQPVFCSTSPVSARITYTSRKEQTIRVNPEKPVEISGEWKISFVPKIGDQPFEKEFSQLTDFSKYNDKSVNYFSGTATYHKKVVVSDEDMKAGRHIILDLGEMNDIAQVRVNGQNLGVLWYPPYRTDITGALKTGENELEIAVTNNWANRLIGDEQEPADFEWGQDRGKLGHAMKAYPDWFLKDQPRPSQGRKTFSVWYYYRKDSPLQPAGLVGPVQLLYQDEEKLGLPDSK